MPKVDGELNCQTAKNPAARTQQEFDAAQAQVQDEVTTSGKTPVPVSGKKPICDRNTYKNEIVPPQTTNTAPTNHKPTNQNSGGGSVEANKKNGGMNNANPKPKMENRQNW